MEDAYISYGMVTHRINDACEECLEMHVRFQDDLEKGIHLRSGICIFGDDAGIYQKCDLHGRVWRGDDPISCQGEFCRECVEEAKSVD